MTSQLPKKDRTGEVYNKLTILAFSHRDNFGKIHWLCKCTCGNEKAIEISCLRGGRTRSCGCLIDLAVLRQRIKGRAKRKQCKLENCSFTANCKGFCKHHYNRHYAGFIDIDGKTLKETKRVNVSDYKICRVEGCGETNKLRKGFCNKHRKWLARGILDQETLKLKRKVADRSVKLITYKGQTKTIKEQAKRFGLSYEQARGRMRKKLPLEFVFMKKPLRDSLKYQKWKETKDRPVPMADERIKKTRRNTIKSQNVHLIRKFENKKTLLKNESHNDYATLDKILRLTNDLKDDYTYVDESKDGSHSEEKFLLSIIRNNEEDYAQEDLELIKRIIRNGGLSNYIKKLLNNK